MRIWRLIAAMIVALAASSSALAGSARDGFDALKHSLWTADEGAPAVVGAIVQSRSGYLWMGGNDGLYRFDGITFDKIPQSFFDVQHSVTAIMETKSGDLWVGFGRNGGLAIYRNGQLQAVPMPDPPAQILKILEDAQGAIWIGTGGSEEHALTRFWHGKWDEVGSAREIPKGDLMDFLIARDGTVWVASQFRLTALRPGSRRFETVALKVGQRAALAEDKSGDVWLSDALGTRMVSGTRSGRTVAASIAGRDGIVRSIAFDHNGVLWRGTRTFGVLRWPLVRSAIADRPPKQFDGARGLSSDFASTIFPDSEGDIWVGTALGLDRFRPADVGYDKRITRSAAGYLADRGPDGTIFVADDRLVHALKDGVDRTIPNDFARLDAICSGTDGSVWLLDRKKIIHWRPGSAPIVLPGTPVDTYGCAQASDGTLWVLGEDNLLRRTGNRFVATGLPAKTGLPEEIARTPSGEIVVKLGAGFLYYPARVTRQLLGRDQLGIGNLIDFSHSDHDLLVSGISGLARIRGDRIARITSHDYPVLQNVRGITQTTAGDTWLFSARGILRIGTRDLDNALAHRTTSLPYRLFDTRDGLSGTHQHFGIAGPQLMAGHNGRLYALTTAGLAVIDPSALTTNALPPPVAIRSLSSGALRYFDPVQISLPKGTTSIEIAFAALSLTIPERVQVRYLLEGVDNQWVDPGKRREAFYTNLGPGRYRFKVIAANNDGVWNRTGATVMIDIAPTFTQTWLFYGLLALIGVLLVWLLYTLRLRQAAGRIQRVMQERLAERERIARDLHDTLLQGVQGLILHFQSIANQMPANRVLRDDMDLALNRAEDVLVEGRNRVGELRVSQGGLDLQQALTSVVRKIAFGSTTLVRVVAGGQRHVLHPLAMDELVKIGSEALFNAHRHAGAHTIVVAIGYFPGRLTLAISDDGQGIPPDLLEKGQRDGHYGLVGIRERARKIGATLSIDSKPGEGTKVTVTVPAKIAYQSPERPVVVRLLHRLIGREP